VEAAAPDPYLTAAPLSGKSLGHTSVVFKLKLEGGGLAVYKLRTKRGPTRYKAEIAAYRLGVALGIPNVPRAFPRSFDAAKLRAVLGGEAGALFNREAIVGADGTVPGAMMPWIDQLEFLPLESEPWASRWKGWVGSGDVPDDQRALAAQISTMLVFDFVTANWDRWSGGNVGFERASSTVLFVDNDGAFYDPPPPGPLAAQLARIRAAERFSKSFVKSLRTLDRAALGAAIGDETPGVPLLTPKVVDATDDRRKAALTVIDQKGDAALAFE
jgi:hypothetical protein